MAFESQLAEAELLISRHDGVHNMHGAIGAIRAVVREANAGILPIDKCGDYIEAVLAKMRITDQTGLYPGRDSEAGERSKVASDALFGK